MPYFSEFDLTSNKHLNRSLILNEIRRNGPTTKISLASKFNLTFPAVGNIISELINSELIEEAGYGESSGGRRPILYKMNWDSIQVVGLVIGVTEISVALVNLKGEILEESCVKNEQGFLMENVYFLIDHLLGHSNKERNKIAGIGVSAPGPIDTVDGKMLTPPNLEGVGNIDIQGLVEKRYGLPTVLEKDANAFALAEQWFGHIQPSKDILYIFNDQGLGGGLIINNRIHRGFGNGSGEIGHMVIDVDGPRCNCGNFGCLEALSSGIAIKRRVKEEIKRGFSTSLANDYLNGLKEPTIEDIIQQAREGDKLSLNILYEAGRYLGIGIANAINLFTPGQVVFGGSVTKLYPEIIKVAEKVAKQWAFGPYSHQIPFVESAFNNQSSSFGAAAVIQQKLFDYPDRLILEGIR